MVTDKWNSWLRVRIKKSEKTKKLCWSQRGNCQILLFIKNKISERAALDRRSEILGFRCLAQGQVLKEFPSTCWTTRLLPFFSTTGTWTKNPISVLKPGLKPGTFKSRSHLSCCSSAWNNLNTKNMHPFYHGTAFVFTSFHPSNQQILGKNEIHYISFKFEGQPTKFLSYCANRGAGDGTAPMLKSVLDVWELSFGANGELHRGFT